MLVDKIGISSSFINGQRAGVLGPPLVENSHSSEPKFISPSLPPFIGTLQLVPLHLAFQRVCHAAVELRFPFI